MALREMSGHLEKERASLRTRKNQNPKGLILVDAQVDWGETILLALGGYSIPRAWEVMSKNNNPEKCLTRPRRKVSSFGTPKKLFVKNLFSKVQNPSGN